MIAAIEDNALGWLPVFARLPGAEVHGNGVVSALAHPLCNSVLMAPDDADVDAIRALGAARGHPRLWWARSTTPGLAARLAAVAVERAPMPGMAMALRDLDAGAAPAPDGVTIEQVGLPGVLRDYVGPLTSAFGFDDPTSRALVGALATSDADLMNWVAYAGDEPVGCASVLVHAGVAGLYNVGVPAAYGRRGIGAALTVRALEAAAQRGIEHAILHASPAGHAIYRRLGFEDLVTVEAYVTPPPG